MKIVLSLLDIIACLLAERSPIIKFSPSSHLTSGKHWDAMLEISVTGANVMKIEMSIWINPKYLAQ